MMCALAGLGKGSPMSRSAQTATLVAIRTLRHPSGYTLIPLEDFFLSSKGGGGGGPIGCRRGVRSEDWKDPVLT
jgi:hypothetical protein